jgi:hypothetical protein
VRVITTVTRDLAIVSAVVFLDQLYYRLNTIVVDAVGGYNQSASKLKYRVPPASPHRS